MQRFTQFIKNNPTTVFTGISGSVLLWYYSVHSPPVGPGRALILGSTIHTSSKKSIRDQDVEWIKKQLSIPPNEIDEQFSVVRGPKGIGKTTAVSWAANGMPGVIFVGSINPGTSSDDIIDKVCKKIINRKENNEESMRRVIYWYRLFTKKTPIVIIYANQRSPNQPPAELTAAARDLASSFGLNVLIDCSENAFPDVKTGREEFLHMEPMSDEMMHKLPEFKQLFSKLKSQGYDELVLVICNGAPLVLKELNKVSKTAKTGEEFRISVERFVMALMQEASSNIKRIKIEYPNMVQVLEKFKLINEIDESELEKPFSGQKMPDFKGVFRKVPKKIEGVEKNSIALVPANGAMALTLRIGINKELSFDELKEYFMSLLNNKK